MLFKNVINAAKRIVDVIGHEDAPLNVDDERFEVVLPPQAPAPSGRTRRIVSRSNQLLMFI